MSLGGMIVLLVGKFGQCLGVESPFNEVRTQGGPALRMSPVWGHINWASGANVVRSQSGGGESTCERAKWRSRRHWRLLSRNLLSRNSVLDLGIELPLCHWS